MESELQEWIYPTVAAEAKKLLSLKSSGPNNPKINTLRNNGSGYVEVQPVQLPGTRVVQIIDFNGQKKAPFTNISISDASCQIRASLSVAAKNQFEKRYRRQLPNRTVGAIFEIGGCSLLFNPMIKGPQQITLSISSLVLKGGEGSSNIGCPTPVEQIEDIHDLIAQMNNTTTHQVSSAKNHYKSPSPVLSHIEDVSEYEQEASDGYLATQAPLASKIYLEHGKAAEKPLSSSTSHQTPNSRSNQLLGLIAKNKKSAPSNSSSMYREEEQRRFISISAPNNQPAVTAEDGQKSRYAQKFSSLTDGGKDAVHLPIDEDTGSSGEELIIHKEQGSIAPQPCVIAPNASKGEVKVENHRADPIGNIDMKSKRELPNPRRDEDERQRWLNMQIHSSIQENPWAKLNRIPRKYVTIPKNQLQRLSTAEAWVTSVMDIETRNTRVLSGATDIEPFQLNYERDTVDQNKIAVASFVEDWQHSTKRHDLSHNSAKSIEKPTSLNFSQRNQRTENFGKKLLGEITPQNNLLSVPDVDGAEAKTDGVVSWASTSRASSINLEKEDVPEVVGAEASDGEVSWPATSRASSIVNLDKESAFSITPVPVSPLLEINSRQTPTPSPSANIFRSMLHPELANTTQISSKLQSFSDSINFKPHNGLGLESGNASLDHSISCSSVLHSEEDMEQALPYAMGDVVQSSGDVNVFRISDSDRTTPPTRSQHSPVLHIERTPYNHSQKKRPPVPVIGIPISHLESADSTPSPHKSVDPIILGTFNRDVGTDDEMSGRSSMRDGSLQNLIQTRQVDGVAIKYDSSNSVGRLKSLSMTPDRQFMSTVTESKRGALLEANDATSELHQNGLQILLGSQQGGIIARSPVIGDARRLPEAKRRLPSQTLAHNVLPSLPSRASPTSKKIVKTYITRRDRRNQRMKLERQFS